MKKKECFTSGPIGSEAYEKGWWETTGAEMVLWPRFGIATERQRNLFLKTIESNPEAFSEFGINWYPFRKEKKPFLESMLGIMDAWGYQRQLVKVEIKSF